MLAAHLLAKAAQFFSCPAFAPIPFHGTSSRVLVIEPARAGPRAPLCRHLRRRAFARTSEPVSLMTPTEPPGRGLPRRRRGGKAIVTRIHRFRRLVAQIALVGLAVALLHTTAEAALCVWRKPDQDIKAFFPGADTYRTDFRTLGSKRAAIEKRLGVKLADETG